MSLGVEVEKDLNIKWFPQRIQMCGVGVSTQMTGGGVCQGQGCEAFDSGMGYGTGSCLKQRV